ncbi:MAG TPA: glycosyltransferase [Vicinamibacterales bacterium]|nr:glycosyltransferase [Vicinamibacterales bacterium]
MTGVRVCFFGRYDPHTLRHSLIARCLARAGADVVSIRDDRALWRRTMPLAARAVGAPRFDLMIVAFRAHSDMAAARLVCSLRRVPLVFDPLTSRYEERVIDRRLALPRGVLARWYWLTDLVGCRLADRLLVETGAQADWFSRTFRVPRARCRRIWLGTDEAVMRPGPARSGGAFTVLFYGRFSPLHGVEHIVEAAARLERRGDPARFVIVGGGQTYAAVRALAERLAVTTITFLDPVPYPELAGLVDGADVCLGSFGTAARAARVIPYKVFDALAAARPVITADTPAVREALTGGEDAWLCPAGDPAALADAIAALEGDPDLRARLARNGRRVFEERLSADAITRDLTAMVSELVKGGRADHVSR